MNPIVICSVCFLAFTGSTASQAQEHNSKKPSTFIEETEPLISIKPLTREDQEKQQLTVNITKIPVVPAAPVIVPVWTLTAGRTVGQELKTWGKKAGWEVVWSLSKDWSIPASTSFAGDFHTAASDVIKTLAANGALVRAHFHTGNNTMVVTGPGVAAQ